MASQYAYGMHSVQALLASTGNNIIVLYKLQGRQDQRIEALIELAKARHVTIKSLALSELNALTGQAKHQGIAVEFIAAREYNEADLEDLVEHARPAFFLILDGITDPHNLGACLRTADAAGVTAVIAPKDRAASLTAVVRKVASGAAETTPFIQVTNLARTLRDLRAKGVWLYGTDEAATQSLYACQLVGNIAFVLGAEGQGMRRLTREHCDFSISLPMLGSVASLNVSVAAGICLYEAVRQRLLQ